MTSRLHTAYRMVVETLSPLHISSGRGDLKPDVDYVLTGKQALVIDLDRLLGDLDDVRLHKAAADPRLSRLLPMGAAARYQAYAIAVSGEASPYQIRESVKDAFHKPYIPGSSLKGALRTGLACATYPGDVPTLTRGSDIKKADDLLETQTFDYSLRQTWKDLLRALWVTDAFPQTASGLQAVPVTVFSLRGAQSPSLQPKPGADGKPMTVFVEAIPKGAVLEGTLTRDEYALQQHPRRPDVTLFRRRNLLDKLVEHCRSASAALVEAELRFYSRFGVGTEVLTFYNDLKHGLATLKPWQFLLWLGWGPGWRSKTVGASLSTDQVLKVVDSFKYTTRDGRLRDPLGRWRTGLTMLTPAFPKSRRLVGIQRPEAPMGWVKVSLLPGSG